MRPNGMRPDGMRPNGMRTDGMRLKGYGSRERGLKECGPTEWIRWEVCMLSTFMTMPTLKAANYALWHQPDYHYNVCLLISQTKSMYK